MGRMERKYLAHYIDASFGGVTNYVRLGKDLEAYAEELNPQVEVRRNILGEQNVIHNGYQVQSTAEPFYADQSDQLFAPIASIANNRLTGEDCKTTRVEVLLDESGNQIWAYKEDCWVVPNSVGGDTSGVQIPFNVYNAGHRVPGAWSVANRTFTETTITLNKTEVALSTATTTVTATITPSASSAVGDVAWSTSDATIATVAGSSTNKTTGTITKVANSGTCVITADYCGARATCVVTIGGNQ